MYKSIVNQQNKRKTSNKHLRERVGKREKGREWLGRMMSLLLSISISFFLHCSPHLCSSASPCLYISPFESFSFLSPSLRIIHHSTSPFSELSLSSYCISTQNTPSFCFFHSYPHQRLRMCFFYQEGVSKGMGK